MSLSFIQHIYNRILDTFWSLGSAHNDGPVLETDLRALLRRFPFWLRGHKLLAESSLSRNEIGQAYAAAQSYRALAQGDSILSADAALLVGRCFLRCGDWHAALGYLLSASELHPNQPRIQEEIAAAYLLGGDHAASLQYLSSIAPEKMSAEGKAALRFVQTKHSA